MYVLETIKNKLVASVYCNLEDEDMFLKAGNLHIHYSIFDKDLCVEIIRITNQHRNIDFYMIRRTHMMIFVNENLKERK